MTLALREQDTKRCSERDRALFPSADRSLPLLWLQSQVDWDSLRRTIARCITKRVPGSSLVERLSLWQGRREENCRGLGNKIPKGNQIPPSHSPARLSQTLGDESKNSTLLAVPFLLERGHGKRNFLHPYIHGSILTLLMDWHACQMLNSTLFILLLPPAHRSLWPLWNLSPTATFPYTIPQLSRRALSYLQAFACKSLPARSIPRHPSQSRERTLLSVSLSDPVHTSTLRSISKHHLSGPPTPMHPPRL